MPAWIKSDFQNGLDQTSRAASRKRFIGGAAFDPGHPWSAPLNALFGWLLKPRKIYHPEYLPKHLGGTLEDQDTTARPTSPFYRHVKGPVHEQAAHLSYVSSGAGPGSHGVPLPVSMSGHQPGGSGAGSHSNAPGGSDPTKDAYVSKRPVLPRGYVDRIPRPKRIRDAQYDPLIERINLARDLRNKDRLTQANEAGMSPEEAAYIRSIGLSGGWNTSLYHMQEIAGLYGWFGSLARPQIGHPVGKVDIADASRGYGRERRFYDQEIGGIGGNISDILLHWGEVSISWGWLRSALLEYAKACLAAWKTLFRPLSARMAAF